MRKISEPLDNQRGIALVAVLSVLALLIVFATIATNSTVTELKVAGNDKRNRLAFFQAESGVEYVRAVIRKGFLDAIGKDAYADGFSDSGAVSAPSAAYDFTVNPQAGSGGSGTEADPYVFSVQSTGRGPNGAEETIEVTFHLVLDDPPIKFGAAGAAGIDFHNKPFVYGFDSLTVADPDHTVDASNGEGGLYSDVKIVADNGAGGNIAAEVVTPGTIDINCGVASTDNRTAEVDPLGALTAGGMIAQKFDASDPNSVVNNNDNGGIPTDWHVSGTVTLGQGDYYFSQITLDANSTINITGPVNIYLSGDLVDNNKKLSINAGGSPQDFALYSNSTGTLAFHNDADIHGLIYAPGADLVFHNKLDLFGAIYSGSFDAHVASRVYYDSQMKYKFLDHDTVPLPVVSWREL